MFSDTFFFKNEDIVGLDPVYQGSGLMNQTPTMNQAPTVR